MKKIWKRSNLLVVALVAIAMILSACGNTTAQSASCAFVRGNGTDVNRDTKLHSIIYPGQTVNVAQSEEVRYVPCNSRNYLINPPDSKDAAGKPVGDRHTPIVAATSTGVQINIWARAFWTLNESDQVLREFYTVCFKYTCWSDRDQGGNSNFSTDGWNGMLGENFGPAMDQAGKVAAIKIGDDIWKNHDPKLYQQLQDDMAAAFAKSMQQNLGFSDDLFCGSGSTSGWPDPSKPGQGKFNCGPVRIVVDEVQHIATSSDQSSQGVIDVNQQRFKNYETIYKDETPYWLGLQDTIDKCAASKSTCIINIGGSGGGPAVVVPSNSPAPSAAAKPSASASVKK